MYYKCARSITGQCMLMFGATATIVGLVAGIGELLGYALRVSFGFIADKEVLVHYECRLYTYRGL